jgi:hypothetical protein
MTSSDLTRQRTPGKPMRRRYSLLLVLLMDVVVMVIGLRSNSLFSIYSSLSPPLRVIQLVVDSAAIVPLVITMAMATLQYKKWRYRHALYLMLAWMFMIISTVSRIVEKLMVDVIKVSFAWYVPISFFMLFLMDSISRDSIDPVKAIVATALSVLYIAFLNSLFILLLILFLISVAVYYLLTIYWNAPRSLKRLALTAVVGGFIFGYGNMISAVLYLDQYVPGASSIMSGVGYALYAVSFAREPRLAYILPFQVVSLTVFETKGGVPLYSHVWQKRENMVDDSMFAGMLQGIRLVLDEAISGGELEEIKLANAVLIVKRSKKYPLACVLVATKFSRTLRNALDVFADKFYSKSNYEAKESLAVNESYYHFADALIAECFAFIPKYDK